jgi:hypothetical protein
MTSTAISTPVQARGDLRAGHDCGVHEGQYPAEQRT